MTVDKFFNKHQGVIAAVAAVIAIAGVAGRRRRNKRTNTSQTWTVNDVSKGGY